MATVETNGIGTAEPKAASASVVLEGRYLTPPADGDGKQWVRTSALVRVEPMELYRRWRNLEEIPLWQEQIERVSVTGERTSHWVMMAGDKKMEWDSEILADEPGRRIAWRSISGDLEQAGEVIFEEAPGNRATMVTVLQEFRLGKLSSALATVMGRNPKQAVIENLRHFKALAETGEIPRSEGQPHGPRGTIAGTKKSMYGEKIPVPQGGEKAALSQDDEKRKAS